MKKALKDADDTFIVLSGDGAAAGMAAGAGTEMLGGTPTQVGHAVALAQQAEDYMNQRTVCQASLTPAPNTAPFAATAVGYAKKLAEELDYVGVLAAVRRGTWVDTAATVLAALAAWLFAFDIARKTVRGTGLPRYIATVETAKHRVFAFIASRVVPDSTIANASTHLYRVIGRIASISITPGTRGPWGLNHYTSIEVATTNATARSRFSSLVRRRKISKSRASLDPKW